MDAVVRGGRWWAEFPVVLPKVSHPSKQNIRWVKPINPLGCRWCGVTERRHGQSWVPSKKWHGWEHPTTDQIKARMLARK